jgi:hypothetical protein
MRRLPRWSTLLLLWPAAALADISVRVPVVTQVQGVVLFHTSVTVANGAGGRTPELSYRLAYRSLADGTFQNATLDGGSILPHRTIFFEDIIQHFKDSGAIRSQDRNIGVFGTLTVTFADVGQLLEDSIVEARTYSSANGGGTNGIAYIGRDIRTAGAETIKSGMRNGSFGADGTTRANIGIVNEGGTATDVELTYFDGATGTQLKELTLTSLLPGEVVQLNNIFADLPAGTRSLVVRAQAQTANGRISGYGVQIDSVTQDGAFFLFVESDECGTGTPG